MDFISGAVSDQRCLAAPGVKRGEAPPNPEKFPPFEMAINLVAGVVIVCVIVAVLAGYWAYSTWSAIAGSTIWCKFIASFALSRHAHASWLKGKT